MKIFFKLGLDIGEARVVKDFTAIEYNILDLMHRVNIDII